MEKVKKQGMESLFCPYELALELKELGFNEPCFAVWSGFDEKNFSVTDTVRLFSSKFSIDGTQSNTLYINSTDNRVSAPLWQQAFRFFREKYGLHYIICKNIQMDGYGYREVILIPYMEENENTIFKTYEEAEVECLVKLIEIAKEQNVK